MANSRIMLVCKHCGKDFCIGKGYFGSYSTSNDELHKQLNIFYGEHEHGCCSEDTDCSDNARNHFAILEEGEDLDVLAADVVPKSEVEELKKAYANYEETTGLKQAKTEVAREIFEEIERLMENNEVYFRQTDEMQEEFAELKKKYTEEKE